MYQLFLLMCGSSYRVGVVAWQGLVSIFVMVGDLLDATVQCNGLLYDYAIYFLLNFAMRKIPNVQWT